MIRHNYKHGYQQLDRLTRESIAQLGLQLLPPLGAAFFASTYVFDYGAAQLRGIALVTTIMAVTIAIAAGAYEQGWRRITARRRAWRERPDWQHFDQLRADWEGSSTRAYPKIEDDRRDSHR